MIVLGYIFSTIGAIFAGFTLGLLIVSIFVALYRFIKWALHGKYTYFVKYQCTDGTEEITGYSEDEAGSLNEMYGIVLGEVQRKHPLVEKIELMYIFKE